MRGGQGGVHSSHPCILLPPVAPASLSHEPVADGAEVFGESDTEDDVGDEEEGAAPQAEPEGILQGESMRLSCAGRGGKGQLPGSRGAWGALVVPQVLTGPLQRGILTQGSAMRSHRMTCPLSRAVASGWHEATSSLSWNEEQRQSISPRLPAAMHFAWREPWGLPGPNTPCKVTGSTHRLPDPVEVLGKIPQLLPGEAAEFLGRGKTAWRESPALPSLASAPRSPAQIQLRALQPGSSPAFPSVASARLQPLSSHLRANVGWEMRAEVSWCPLAAPCSPSFLLAAGNSTPHGSPSPASPAGGSAGLARAAGLPLRPWWPVSSSPAPEEAQGEQSILRARSSGMGARQVQGAPN